MSHEALRHIWRHRGRRCVTGLNVCFSVGLAALLALMLNVLFLKHIDVRWDISTRGYYTLSDKTQRMLATLEGRVRIVAFLQNSDDLYDDVRFLLKEYEYAASRNAALDLRLDVIDPDRDPARADELARAFETDKPNVVVFESGERRKYVETRELMDYERRVDYEKLLAGKPSVTRRKVGFNGEQVFSSAILGVVRLAPPVVYFLVGHGEQDIENHSEQSGYSSVARNMRRDNIDVRALLLAESGGVPEDCSAVIVAGPDRRISQAEVDALSAYLDRNGRLMLLSDSGTAAGMESLLARWGVKVGNDVVVGLTLTGRELFVTSYGDHPITRRFKDVTTMFYRPRSMEPVAGNVSADAAAADRPKVVAIASCNNKGWADANLEQNPPKFDPETDRKGPVSIAVAVERGPVSGIQVEIRPTRLVVIGDSAFVSNGALRSGVGGNMDFFMSALNWLLEREALIGVGPKVPGVLSLEMSRGRQRAAFLVIVFGVPSLAALLGMAVWYRRRQ